MNEERFLESIDIAEGWKLIERFSTLVRESGSEHERQAAEYIAQRLKTLGIPFEMHRPRLLISLPRESRLALLPEGETVPAKTVSFAAPTPAGGIEAEVVYIPAAKAQGTSDLFDLHLDRRGADLQGKIALTEGLAMPATVRTLEGMGAAGQIFIHPGKNIHEGICTTIWGTPTPESAGRIPNSPVVCVNREDGTRLVEAAGKGGLRVGLETRLERAWKECLLPVAHIEGREEPDLFLLLHGHYDSWHVGIGDNATGNAALLELARIFHQNRNTLRRSLRVAWWPAHSTGRYAGSTWYADRFAGELDESCIAQVNVDSPGCRGAAAFEEVMWMMECDHLCRQVIRDRTGRESHRMRPLRAGDYSFNQIGLTSFFMLLSNRPAPERRQLGFYPVGGCGGDIAWHTEDDTLPVADREVLRQDLGIYVSALVRVLNAEVFPFDFRPCVQEMARAIGGYQERCGPAFSLQEVETGMKSLSESLQEFHDAIASGRISAGLANRTILSLGRRLVPLNYALGERFDHDPALPLGIVPKLEKAVQLADLDAGSDRHGFLETELTRNRNKVCAALKRAQRQVRSAIEGGATP